MTYPTQAAALGRQPLVAVEIDLDFCTRTYGVGACTASIGTTGSRKCYNTRKTCQVAAAFDRTPKTYRFSPIGTTFADPAWPAIPCLVSASTTPSTIDIKGLASAEVVTIRLQDFTFHDRGVDPYVPDRAWGDNPAGTWLGRWLARNAYHEGRPVRLLTGYTGADGKYSAAQLTTRRYVIDKIDGPTPAGVVTITAKDPITLANDDKAQFPAPSTGNLVAAMTTSTTSIAVASGTETGYPSSGFVCIDKEVCEFTRSGTTFTLTDRHAHGTTADNHDAGATVQLCAVFDEERVDSILEQLFNAAGIDDSLLDLAGWMEEADTWLSGSLLSCVLTKPSGIKSLITEVCEQGMASVWWDSRAQLVRMRGLRPALFNEVTPLTEASHILADSVAAATDPAARLSTIVVRHGLKVATDDPSKVENFTTSAVVSDLDAVSAPQYGSDRSALINARWIPATGTQLAGSLATQLLLTYRDPPVSISLRLDAKDGQLWAGDSVSIATRQQQDDTGASPARIYLITQAKEVTEGTAFEYRALRTGLTTRYAVIMPDGSPDYAAATAEQRDPGGFIGTDAALSTMPNGDEPYLIS